MNKKQNLNFRIITYALTNPTFTFLSDPEQLYQLRALRLFQAFSIQVPLVFSLQMLLTFKLSCFSLLHSQHVLLKSSRKRLRKP